MRIPGAVAAVAVLLAGCTTSPGIEAPTPSGSEPSAPTATPGTTAAGPAAGCPDDPAEATARSETLRGVNVAGGEFTHTPEGLPGSHGEQYRYAGAPLL